VPQKIVYFQRSSTMICMKSPLLAPILFYICPMVDCLV
jgi:hypothetical protein